MTETNLIDYEKSLELAETGKHAEALAHIQKHLEMAPDDTEALNDAGVLLHCLNRSDEAVEYLLKAKSIKPESIEILWNLSEAFLTIGKAKEAIELFGDMERMGVLNPDVLSRTANILLSQGNLTDALKILQWSLRLSPDQEILQSMIEVIRHQIPEDNCE